jgi:hypothetical protein
MADLSVTPVASQIKPVPGMSLGEMMNFARGAQAYQQTEQMNPLLLQQQRQAVDTGQIALTLEQQKEQERQRLIPFLQDPKNLQSDGRFDINKVNADILKIAPLTGSKFIQDFTQLRTLQTQSDQAIQSLSNDERNVIASALGAAGRQGVKDRAQVYELLDDIQTQYPQSPTMKNLINSYKGQLRMAGANADLPSLLIGAANQVMSPAQQQTAFAPTIQATPEGRTVTTQPAIGTAAPTATIGVVGNLQPTQPAQPTGPVGSMGSGAQVAPGMRIPYPVRTATQPYIPEPTEVADQTAGQTYRNALVGRQPTLATDRRNVEETIAQAQKIESQMVFQRGGVAGNLERKVRTAIQSDDYKMLAKDLANLQISNLRALGQGGSTVAGMDLTRVASGDETVPPGTLIKIARRAQADMTNIDMQATGAEQFKNRFGDNNMNAYKQAWNANADTKIFEAINITRDVTDPAQREKELNRLFPNEKSRAEFLTKYRNLRKLSETGSL